MKHRESPYAKYTWTSKDPKGGFGREVFGETWVNHYGVHEKESTRGLIAPGMENDPLVRGVKDIWGPSDVYEVTTFHGDCRPVILGQVLQGMNPGDPPNPKKQILPVAWTKSYTGTSGKASRIFVTTMGHAGDFQCDAFRRLVVNACYWATGMEAQIPTAANVEFIGAYAPAPIHHDKHKKGLKPADYKM